MDTYKYRVTLDVEIEAFDENDADTAIEETFGVGEDCGVNIVRSKVAYRGKE